MAGLGRGGMVGKLVRVKRWPDFSGGVISKVLMNDNTLFASSRSLPFRHADPASSDSEWVCIKSRVG
jgi:hypothetical protein